MKAKFYVPFETAQLLDKKGYPQSDSDMYYTRKGELKSQADIYADRTDNDPMMYSYYLTTYHIAAPAYCEVLDWLVSKDIYINVDRTGNTLLESGSVWHCYIWERDTNDWCMATREYPTREEAINSAILKLLENVL